MKRFIKIFLLKLIELIERLEFYKLDLNENDHSKKILETIKLDDVKVETPNGYVNATHYHKTQPYRVYELVLENGYKLECADLHLVQVFKPISDDDGVLILKTISELEIGDFVITDDGASQVKSIKRMPYKLSMLDLTIDSEDHLYFTNGILSHNTIMSCIFNAWYICFHFDKNVLLLSNTGGSAKEIMDKTKIILMNLPFFLKPGVSKNDVMQVRLDNGSRLVCQATTKKAGIGMNIHVLYMDEFAHIHPNFVKSFFENAYPTVSASKTAKVIITSTPNGTNKFYEMWESAINGKSEFHPFKINWWDIPWRDEAWKQSEIANLGSERAFQEQYGNQFIAGDNMLLSPDELGKFEKHAKPYVHHRFEKLDDIEIDYSGLTWHPDFDVNTIKDEGNYFIVSVDIAEGLGGDYSVINIFKIEPIEPIFYKHMTNITSLYDFFRLKQVGLFKSNKHTTDQFSKVLYTVLVDIFDSENTRVVLEWNVWGDNILNRLSTVFPSTNAFEEEMILRFKHTKDSKVPKPGLRLRPDNKNILCVDFKTATAKNKIIVSNEETIKQISSFGRVGGSYKGQMNNDDMAMTCINVTSALQTVDFQEFVEEAFDYIPKNVQKKIDKYLDLGDRTNSMDFDVYDIV